MAVSLQWLFCEDAIDVDWKYIYNTSSAGRYLLDVDLWANHRDGGNNRYGV